MSSVPPSPPGLVHDGRLKTVYRYYHRNTKELLYVGQTVRIASRGKEHRDTKQWWEAVGLVVYEHLAVGSTAADLDNAERRAIGRGWPLHNQQHNPARHAWVADQYPAMVDHEHWFSYDLVELFARTSRRARGPYRFPRRITAGVFAARSTGTPVSPNSEIWMWPTTGERTVEWPTA